MAPLKSTQPFKAIFTFLFVSKFLLYLIPCSLCYILPSLRPFPDWNFRLSLGVKLSRTYFRYVTEVLFQHPPQLKPRSSRERFVWVEPPPSEVFTGPLAQTTISATPVGVVWHPTLLRKSDPDLKDRKVCIHAIGGAFVLGWDPEALGKTAQYLLSKYFGASHVLYTQYRLAGPQKHFPAAVQDLLTSYHYVLGLGIPAENIIITGDSAGGNLVLALLRYLETTETKLPRPGGAILLSPWVDVTSTAVRRYEQSPLGNIDLLYGPLLMWGLSSYRPQGEISADMEGYISPANHPFSTGTPLFIDAGTKEGFHDSIQQFAEDMSKVEGNQVCFHAAPHMPHDYLLLFKTLGVEREAGMTLEAAQEFFESTSK